MASSQLPQVKGQFTLAVFTLLGAVVAGIFGLGRSAVESGDSELDRQQEVELRDEEITCATEIRGAIEEALADLGVGLELSRDQYFTDQEERVCAVGIGELEDPDDGEHWVTPYVE